MRKNDVERKKIEQGFYIMGCACLIFALILYLVYQMYPVMFQRMMPCMFYKVIGLYCPGCGGSRAVAALLKGKIILSFCLHPIVVYGGVIYVWFMVSHTIEKISRGKMKIGMRYRDAYLWIALVIVVVNVVVKNAIFFSSHQDILQILSSYI